MTPTAKPLPAGAKGFDCNTPVLLDTAHKFVAAGYRYVLRYLPRVTAKPHDLSGTELTGLLNAGLAVMGVQHVASESSWVPTDDTGRQYGQGAADHAQAVGLVKGSTVWLDLEGVAPGTDPEAVIRYCNYWHGRVAAAGFQPGIYVGWHAGLSSTDLYKRLRFQRYWSAYNLNADQMPAVRGVCMRQHAAKPGDVPAGVPFQIDTNTAQVDALGGSAMVCAPDGWA